MAAIVNSTATNGNLVLENCVLQSNSATTGAVYSPGGALTLTNTKILTTTGTGVTVNASNRPFALTMTDSVIEGNTFKGVTAAGLNVVGSEVTVDIKNSSISKNISTTPSPGGDAVMQGGGIRVTAPSAATSGSIVVNITDSTISENAILGGDGGWGQYHWGGAGMYVTSKDSAMDRSEAAQTNVTLTTNITGTTFEGNYTEVGTGYYKSDSYGVALYTDGNLNIFGSNFDKNGKDHLSGVGVVFIRPGAKGGSNLVIQKDAQGNPTLFQNNVPRIGTLYVYYDNYWGVANIPPVGMLVEDAIFKNNSSGWGMGIYIDESYPSFGSEKIVRNSQFINNSSTATFEYGSAAIVAVLYSSTGVQQDLRIENSQFTGNQGYSKGGGVYFDANSANAKLFVADSTFSNNTITGTGTLESFGGGAIYMSDAAQNLGGISNTSFSNNSAPEGRYTAVNPFADRSTNILSVTQPFTHPFNNFDINYTGGVLAEIYTVTFDTQGGTAVAAVKAMNSVAIQQPADPTKTNYTLVGWSQDAEGTMPWDFANDVVTSDITLYANWALNRYDVHFNSNGGTSVDSLLNVEHGSLLTAPAEPARTGFTFGGWYKEEQLQTMWDFTADTVQNETTLYAKWVPLTFTVQFNSQGGSNVPALTGVLYGTVVAAPSAPVRTGYTFDGWYQDAAGTIAWNFATGTITQDTTLFARWIAVPVSSSQAPSSSSSAPVSSSSAPVSSSSAPVSSSSAPVSSSSAPVSSSSTPVSSSSTPVSSSSAPVSSSSAPASSSSASASSSPAAVTSSSATSSTAPASSSTPTAGNASQNREEVRERLIDSGVPTIQMGNTEVPLFGGGEGFVWSLLSLLLAVASVVTSVFIVVKMLINRGNEEEQNRNLFKIIAIALGFISLVAFFIVYSLSGVMVFIDAKTILFVVLLAAEIVSLLVSKRKPAANGPLV